VESINVIIDEIDRPKSKEEDNFSKKKMKKK
jgi:hypothetical protein